MSYIDILTSCSTQYWFLAVVLMTNVSYLVVTYSNTQSITFEVWAQFVFKMSLFTLYSEKWVNLYKQKIGIYANKELFFHHDSFLTPLFFNRPSLIVVSEKTSQTFKTLSFRSILNHSPQTKDLLSFIYFIWLWFPRLYLPVSWAWWEYVLLLNQAWMILVVKSLNLVNRAAILVLALQRSRVANWL